MLGVKYGWKGMLNADAVPLTRMDVEEILPLGGTILKTSRTNPFKVEGGPQKVIDNAKKMGIDCLVAVGGEDTLGVANKLTKMGLNCVGVPKTIDNDLGATDYTFGYQTAVQIATDAMDRLHTTARSHDRVIVCEIMGRHAGWMATDAGTAASAHWIFIPEVKGSLNDCCEMIKKRYQRGDRYAIIAVSEGAEFSRLQRGRKHPRRRTRSATSSWAASPRRWPRRSRSAQAARPERSCSGTPREVARRWPTTGYSAPGSAARPPR